MPVSVEGHPYTRYLFKPVDNSKTGGCHADVFIPDNKPAPVPVAITYHGGAFTICDSQHIFADHVGYLLDRGFAVVSLEYRLAPHVRFTQQREDMLDGYKWTINTLPGLLEGSIDASRAFVFGGSAGGSATLFVAADALREGVPLPKALYSVYPMADLDLKEGGHPHTPYEEALAALTPDERGKVDALLKEPVTTGHDIKSEDHSNPSGRMIWARMVTRKSALNAYLTGEYGPPFTQTHSALHNCSAGFPPTVLVLAKADQVLDPSQTRAVYEKLRSLGVEAKLIEAEGMTHGAIEQPRSTWPEGNDWWENVATPALEWCIEKCQ